MGKVKRAEFVNPARRIGRSDAIKKRCGNFIQPASMKADNCHSDMIAGSQRRKKKALREREGHMHSEVSADDVEEGSS
jgi:ATP-dependent RNA helicase DDX52/ROK1